jgi:hypothetical protein
MYIVIEERNGEKFICFDGRKPLLTGDKKKAKDTADFLKSVNQASNYRVCSVRELACIGEVKQKYS